MKRSTRSENFGLAVPEFESGPDLADFLVESGFRDPRTEEAYNLDVNYTKLLVRSRLRIQKFRVAVGGALGVKADGEDQELDEPRLLLPEDRAAMVERYEFQLAQEASIEKELVNDILPRHPIYQLFFKNIPRCGSVAPGVFIAEVDPFKMSSPSSLWLYSGFSPCEVQGYKMVADKKGDRVRTRTDTMIAADRLTPGFLSPYNTRLRTVAHVLGENFCRGKNWYYLNCYLPYKHRLETSDSQTTMRRGPKSGQDIAWKDVRPGHRHLAALRYMLKMFEIDLHRVWRSFHGLSIRVPYHEEKMGRKHHAA